MPSPVGELLLAGDGEALLGAWFLDEHAPPRVSPTWVRDDGAFGQAVAQLRAYFARELTAFDLPLAPRGTPFQQRMWAALREVPYGATTTYARLAEQLGKPRAARAVGLANGRNPLAVVIPCHRVLGSDGRLTGYAGGLHRKQWLLALEGRPIPSPGRRTGALARVG